MDIGFYIDPETGAPHIYNHDIDENEIAEVLRNPGEDRAGHGGARVASVKPAAAVICELFMLRLPQPDTIFVITAYELQGKPLTAYRRRRRRRHRQ